MINYDFITPKSSMSICSHFVNFKEILNSSRRDEFNFLKLQSSHNTNPRKVTTVNRHQKCDVNGRTPVYL